MMRSRVGCQSCRARHIKCVKLAGSEKCQKCLEAQRECLLGPQARFRAVRAVRFKAANGRKNEQNLVHNPSQVWVDIPSKVKFVDFDLDSADFEGSDSAEEEIITQSDESLRQLSYQEFDLEHSHIHSVSQLLNKMSPNEDASQFHSALPSLQQDGRSSDFRAHTSPDLQRNDNLHSQIRVSPAFQQLESPLVALQVSPNFQQDESPHLRHHSQNSLTPHSIPSIHSTTQASAIQYSSPILRRGTNEFSLNVPWPFRNVREARLIHHYIRVISPWIDVCDKQSHFGREVPKRIAHHPVILNAILASASRQLSLMAGTEDVESAHYVSECLRILISTLEDPVGHWDENLLAAVVILRTHEEMSDVDEKHHLFGTTKLLNSIASFAADGGMREAASWAALRQHIYISLTSQNPLTINLENYRESSSFRDSGDESWANRIVFIFASILTCVFNPNGEQLSPDKWDELQAEVEAWDALKPWTFTPLWVEKKQQQQQQQGEDGDQEEGSTDCWPEVLMSHPAQVVGLQYHCLAKIILSIYDPRLSKLGFGSHRLRKASEAVVLENLRMVVGLSVSNQEVYNAMFQVSHIISACGAYFSDPREQEAIVEFLLQVTQRMGWRTSHIISDLRRQWKP